jgi:putative spermidine/putrescine transport system permease protein
MKLSPSAVSWLQVSPLGITLLFFFGIPMLMIVFVSFCEYTAGEILFSFTVENYQEIFSSSLTYSLYFNSLKYTFVVWAISVIVGFWISYFLAFHVKSLRNQILLFLVCTIPFLTSVIIRMISWIPVLGREGLLNGFLLKSGVIDAPIDYFLYSDFSVIVAYVHLYTLFMIVPIFNSMARIDRALITAASDAGAAAHQILFNIILPLTKSGIALGSIFVVSLVMGDFFVLKVMSGGQRASVVSALYNEIASLQYPPAAANAVVLVLFVSIIISLMLRVVDIRKELSD